MDDIWDVTESVFKGFLTYSFKPTPVGPNGKQQPIIFRSDQHYMARIIESKISMTLRWNHRHQIQGLTSRSKGFHKRCFILQDILIVTPGRHKRKSLSGQGVKHFEASVNFIPVEFNGRQQPIDFRSDQRSVERMTEYKIAIALMSYKWRG